MRWHVQLQSQLKIFQHLIGCSCMEGKHSYRLSALGHTIRGHKKGGITNFGSQHLETGKSISILKQEEPMGRAGPTRIFLALRAKSADYKFKGERCTQCKLSGNPLREENSETHIPEPTGQKLRSRNATCKPLHEYPRDLLREAPPRAAQHARVATRPVVRLAAGSTRA